MVICNEFYAYTFFVVIYTPEMC